MPLELTAIQAALRDAGLDGWLFYDHHHRDPIAYRVLRVAPRMCTRRWYYLVPAKGGPQKLVHRIERANLDGLPGSRRLYSSWQEQHGQLRKMVEGCRRVAMQYSPMNDVPYVGLVDAGTVELVRGLGIEVVSSADLVQLFEARWSPEQLESHLEAGKAVHEIIRQAFAFIADAVRNNRTIGEFDVQQEIVRLYGERGLWAEEPPIVAVNENTANPHYSPERETSAPVRPGDFVLLDVWAKVRQASAVYFDVTWTGFAGAEVPRNITEIFDIVREARDTAVELVRASRREGRDLPACAVDDAARAVIARSGYGEYFVHRTGHSIGEDVHGNGANIDNFETRDARHIVSGTCFSIEPGIYLADFGVRSEVNVFVEESDARVTGELQQAVVPILAAAL